MLETATVALATFFATIGPLDVAAVFAALTANFTRQRRRQMAVRGTIIASCVLLLFAITGEWVLELLGISLPALRTAGGILLLLIGNKLAWGKHLYVDDLVTDPDCRSRGAGRMLLNWLQEQARAEHCVQFHLDSGTQRQAAHRFYFREGLTISSFHFQCEASDDHPT